MNRPWFDTDTGLLLLDEYVAAMPSFQQITADRTITDEEIAGQALRVAELLQALEVTLTPVQKNLATDALCELSVLHALTRIRAR